MKTFYVRIVWRKSLNINLTLDEMRQVPTTKHSLWHYHEELIQVDYTPGAADFDEEKFRKFQMRSLKRQFKNVVSVSIMNDVSMLK